MFGTTKNAKIARKEELNKTKSLVQNTLEETSPQSFLQSGFWTKLLSYQFLFSCYFGILVGQKTLWREIFFGCMERLRIFAALFVHVTKKRRLVWPPLTKPVLSLLTSQTMNNFANSFRFHFHSNQMSGGSSYFVDYKRGEVKELKACLRNSKIIKDPANMREVVKKVIAYMTLGIDVSQLFSEMVMVCQNFLLQRGLVHSWIRIFFRFLSEKLRHQIRKI